MFKHHDQKNQQATAAGLKIGDKAEDGWIYAGTSPTTHRPMFVSPEDIGVMKWEDARKAAYSLQEQGKAEARLPSDGELSAIFNNKADIGGFKKRATISTPADWYWTATQDFYPDYVHMQNIKNGKHDIGFKPYTHSVRLVRS